MVKVREDLTGQKFGRLTVLYQSEDYIKPDGRHESKWHCICNCEYHNEVDVMGSSLKRGQVKSCGCLWKESILNACKKSNDIKVCGDYCEATFSNVDEKFYFDTSDLNLVKQYCWLKCKGYPMTRLPNTNKLIKLHQLLGLQNYDHADRDKTNNCRSNLRPCTKQENNINRSKNSNNTSGFIGISWNKKGCKWESYIMHNGKRKSLGRFIDINDAIVARLNAELKYFGEFAPQKDLFEQYNILG